MKPAADGGAAARAASPALRKALLVEDDLAIGRLLEAVAQDVGVDLVHATSLAQADQALEAAPGARGGGFHVIVADLMLPDGSGVDWLEAQWSRGRLADTRVVAFSAGVSSAVRARLGAVGVQGFLHKPVSVTTLAQWLAPEDRPGVGREPAGVVTHLQEPEGRPGATRVRATLPGPRGARAAIAELFGGDHELFEQFQAACLQRMPADHTQGQQWLAQGRFSDLARLAHSLKSALRLLGEPALAAQAQALEHRCAAPQDGPGVHAAWARLCQGLCAWSDRTGRAGHH